MRKYFVLLFLILCPAVVLADSAGPSIIGYDAVVINKNGIRDGDVTISYNTKIHVYDEDNSMVYACHIEYANDCYNDDNRFSASFKDIALLKEEIAPSDLEKKYNEGTVLDTIDSKVLISNKNGVKLHKGPADAYGYYNQTIPYKTILNFKYVVNRSRFGISWIYVDENGYKGWIENPAEGGAFCVLNSDSLLTFTNITITDDNNNKVEIPKETVLNKVYEGYPTIFIEYKGTLGKVERDKAVIGHKSNLGYIYTTKSIELKSGGKTVSAIPKGKKIKILYASADDLDGDYPYHATYPVYITSEKKSYYYIEYNGTKGFVSDDYVVSLYYESEETIVEYDEDTEIYDVSCYAYTKQEVFNFGEYSKKCKTDKTIPANAKVRLYYSGSEIVDNSTNKRYNANLIKYQNEYGLVINELDNNEEENTSITENPNVEIEKNTNSNDNRVLTIIIYSLIAAGVLSLTAYVTIMLINKKKTQKKEVVSDKTEIKNIKKENSSEKKKEK